MNREACSLVIDYKPIPFSKSFRTWLSLNESTDSDARTFFNHLTKNEGSIDLSTTLVDLIKKIYGSRLLDENDNETPSKLLKGIKNELNKLKVNIDEDFDDTFLKILNELLRPKEIKSDDGEGETNRKDENVYGNEIELSHLTNRQLMKSLFGKVNGALISVPSKFKSKIREHAFINLDEGKFIYGGNFQFNKSIITYQNDLFRTLTDYLIEHDYKILNQELYTNSNGVLTLNPNALNYLEDAFDEILKNIKLNTSEQSNKHIDKLKEGWGSELKLNFGKRVDDLENLKYYRFVEAAYTLKNFDSLLENTFGKTISFVKSLKGLFATVIKSDAGLKYYYGVDKSGRNSGFTDDNKRNGFTEAGRFSIALLESLPLYSYSKRNEASGKRQGQYINQIRVTTTFTKLLNAVIDGTISTAASLKNSEYSDFIRSVLDLHSNPKKKISNILNILFNGENYTDAKILQRLQLNRVLNENEIDTLYSLWKNVYNTSDDEGWSIVKLENKNRPHGFNKEGFIYSDCISGLVDRVTELKYLSVQYDEHSGDLSLRLRKKFQENSKLFRIRDKTNDYIDNMLDEKRVELLNKYKITDLDGKQFEIAIDKDLSLVINPNKEKNSGDYTVITSPENTIFVKKGDTQTKIDDYFTKIEEVDFTKNIDKDSNIYKVLKFFEDTLYYKLLTDDGLETLHLYLLDSYHMFEDLAEGAIRSVLINLLYHKFNNLSKYTDLGSFLVEDELGKKLYPKLGSIVKGKFTPDNIKNKLYRFGEEYTMITAPQNLNWLDGLSSAESLLSGETTKSTSTNFEGHKELNGRTNHLGAEIQHYILKTIDEANEFDSKVHSVSGLRMVASRNLLFNNDSLRTFIKGQIMSSDIKARDGKIKTIKSLKTASLLFTNIFHNFFGMLNSDGKSELNGLVAILPTTYADKSSIISYLIDGSTKFDFDNIHYENGIANLSDNELVTLVNSSVGKFYLDIAANVIDDYSKIFAEQLKSLNKSRFEDLFELNQFLLNIERADGKPYTEFDLIREANRAGVTLLRDTHYSIYNGRLGVNPLLYQYVLELYSQEDTTLLKNRLDVEKLNFINSIIKSNIYIQTTESSVKDAMKAHLTSLEIGKWTKNSTLVIAILHENGQEIKITLGDPIDVNKYTVNKQIGSEPWVEINPLLNRYFNAINAVAPSLRLTLTGSEIAHPLKKCLMYSNSSKILDTFKKVDANIAKKLGLTEDEFKKINIIAIKGKIDSLVDSPLKQSLLRAYDEIMVAMEGIGGAEGTQLKRNVIVPATLQYVQQKALNSINDKIKVAVISDILAYVNTFNGIKDHEDSLDGSALINPFFSILENNGLQDQAVGFDKKPIWHHYNNTLGTATLLKYATYTMTNLRMLQSLFSDTSLYNLFKKMTNIQWSKYDNNGNIEWTNSKGCKIDLVHGKRYGHDSSGKIKDTIDFHLDILSGLSGNRLLYGIGGNYMQITDLNYDKIEGVGSNIYYTLENKINLDGSIKSSAYRVYHLFDENGKDYRFSRDLLETLEIKNKISSRKLHTINSLFELHSALGGIFSIESKNGEFVTSENSNKAVTNYMNIIGDSTRKQIVDNISEIKDEEKPNFRVEKILTQDEYYQPLKEMMISVAANPSAMKNGVNNVNPASSWRDNTELTYMEMDSDGYGIQQDSDHEADEAEMTEPTQVMTALDLGGYLHKYVRQIYQSVGRVTLSASRVEIGAVNDFIEKYSSKNPEIKESSINKLYDIVGRIILNNLSTNSEDMDLSDEILQEIRSSFGINSDNHATDSLKIAFSDPNIYGHVIPTIISTLNAKGIRRKNPGSGMVMAPAYGIFLTFNYKGKTVTMSDLLKLVKLDGANINKNLEFKVRGLESNDFDIDEIQNQVREILNKEQQTKEKSDYNSFDLGDIVNVYGEHDTSKVYVSEEGEEPWKNLETGKVEEGKSNKIVHFKLNSSDNREFILKVENRTGNASDPEDETGEFSVHFRTLNDGKEYNADSAKYLLTEKEKLILIQRIGEYLQNKSNFNGLRTRGTLTKGGISGLSRFMTQLGMTPSTGNAVPINIKGLDLQNENSSDSRRIDQIIKKGLLTNAKRYKGGIKGDLLLLRFGELPHVEIYIDSVDKYYYLKDKNWVKLSNNKDILNRLIKNIKKYSADPNKYDLDWLHKKLLSDGGIPGLISFITDEDNAEFNIPSGSDLLSDDDLNALAEDDILKLYQFDNYKYQENVTRSRDLGVTRILFLEDGKKKSIYDVPEIRRAFTSTKEGDTVSNKKMAKIFDDLSKGHYYDDYLEVVKKDPTDPKGEKTYIDIEHSGQEHKITNLKYYKPLAIVSNMWAKRFNTKTYKSLDEVNSSELFNIEDFKESIEKYPSGKAEMRFLKTNGEHTYLSFSKINRSDRTREVSYEKVHMVNFRKEKTKINQHDVYKIIALDNSNFDRFEIGRQVELDNLKFENNAIVDKDGKLVENTKDLVVINGKVFKTFNYLNLYRYNHDHRTDILYSIDKKAIDEIANITKEDALELLSKSTLNLYNEDSYIAFDLNIKDKSIFGSIRGKKGTGVIGILGANNPELLDYSKSIIKGDKANLDNILKNVLNEIRTSFELSKQIIASRIPAQSLQSFMPMEIVGYTLMELNVAYVSHIQTFLQGSDYDIDKSYMLSYFFDDNGRFIKWSPLMSLNSKEELDASVKLPVPGGVKLTSLNDKTVVFANPLLDLYNRELNKLKKTPEDTKDRDKQISSLQNKIDLLKEDENIFLLDNQKDITDYLVQIKNINPNNKVELISAYADFIDFIDQNSIDRRLKGTKSDTPIFLYTYDKSKINESDAKIILDEVRRHEDYIIPEAIREHALQNANSSKIQLIILDWHNVNSAHININMDDARFCTSRKLGNSERTSLLNPASIFEMLVENQTGKNVIGIAANGEKAFFTLYYYFTECLQKFALNHDLNLEHFLSFRKEFYRIKGRWDADADPNNPGKPLHAPVELIANLNRLMTLKGDDLKFEVDLMISLLLSAATDNAKELILAKINAGEQFAKIYFYGLILGFSLNDLAAFMTSPAVELISDLSLSNLFDESNNSITPDKVLDIIQRGNYPFGKYLGDNKTRYINSLLSENGYTVILNDKKHTSQIIHSLLEWAKLKNEGLISTEFKDFISKIYDTDRDSRVFYNEAKALQLSEYIEGTSRKIMRAIYQSNPKGTFSEAKSNFDADIKEFKNLWNMSNEMTTFTNVFLNTNQGLPTTLDKYIKKLIGILNTVRLREKELTAKFDSNDITIRDVIKAYRSGDGKLKAVDMLVQLFAEANPLYINTKVDISSGDILPEGVGGESYLKYIAQKALESKIVGSFSYDKWFTSLKYRDLTKEYYNCIKGTFNIFHFLDVHPQYKANFKLFSPSYTMITKTNLKTRLILALQGEYQDSLNFWDNTKNKDLANIADEVIMRKFLEDSDISIKIDPSWKILNYSWNETNNHGEEILKIDEGLGYSNFKYLMENYIIPGLLDGTIPTYRAGKQESVESNSCIKAIEKNVSFNRPYLSLDIDLSKRLSSPTTNIKFEEYSQGFRELKLYQLPSFKVDGKIMTVLDLIVLYNLIVNKNQYGAFKFTSLFKSTISKNDKSSMLYKYLKYIGELDLRSYDISEKELLPLIDDMQIALAPIVSKYLMDFMRDKYIKVRENGLLTLYEKIGEKYEEAKVFMNEFGEKMKPNSTQSINFAKYNCLFSSNKDSIQLLAGRLQTKDAKNLVNALRDLIAINKLIILSTC